MNKYAEFINSKRLKEKKRLQIRSSLINAETSRNSSREYSFMPKAASMLATCAAVLILFTVLFNNLRPNPAVSLYESDSPEVSGVSTYYRTPINKLSLPATSDVILGTERTDARTFYITDLWLDDIKLTYKVFSSDNIAAFTAEKGNYPITKPEIIRSFRIMLHGTTDGWREAEWICGEMMYLIQSDEPVGYDVFEKIIGMIEEN